MANPKGHVATISRIENHLPRKPCVCPGILDPAFSDKFFMLVGDFIDKPLEINPKHPISYIYLFSTNDIVNVAPCGSLCDPGLPNPAIHVTLPPFDAKLAPENYAEALALLEKYSDLFSKPHNFGTMKGTPISLYLEENRPF